ncbi:MAG: hypothetical protein HY080_07675 [Gammaproteobacteria bacterium]|nr:hypothetical protein [Gammaproteobacteria bacterium]
MRILSLAVVILAALISGCAYNASPYGASIRNVESIKSANIKPVAVAPFKSSKPGLDSITCRAAGPVIVKPNFETYIEKALIDELKLAGVYNQNSELVLTGNLENVDFSSGMTDGKWIFSLIVSNNKNQSFTANSTYEFSGSFIADKACQEVAQAFGPAIQKLIEDVVQNPKFRQLAH